MPAAFASFAGIEERHVERIITALKEHKAMPGPVKRQERPVKRPADVSEQVWTDWLRTRRTKGFPVTETAMQGITREAEKAGWPVELVLIECMARGWRGFKADWVEGKPRPDIIIATRVDPDAGKLLARYEAGEISFDEFDRLRNARL